MYVGCGLYVYVGGVALTDPRTRSLTQMHMHTHTNTQTHTYSCNKLFSSIQCTSHGEELLLCCIESIGDICQCLPVCVWCVCLGDACAWVCVEGMCVCVCVCVCECVCVCVCVRHMYESTSIHNDMLFVCVYTMLSTHTHTRITHTVHTIPPPHTHTHHTHSIHYTPHYTHTVSHTLHPTLYTHRCLSALRVICSLSLSNWSLRSSACSKSLSTSVTVRPVCVCVYVCVCVCVCVCMCVCVYT